MKIHPVTLQGVGVRLEPLTENHTHELSAAGSDPQIWKYLPYGEITNPEKMREYIRTQLVLENMGTDLPFAVIHTETGKPIGCTRYLDIRKDHWSLEIGGTWYASAYQRTKVNTECKYLLLKHAFEFLCCIRVQFKTDLRNLKSQRALERIGAVKEGILRNHMILAGGFVRDSVIYSIISDEWSGVKNSLEGKLA